MADIRITNCHVHTFTHDHVPRHYPHPLATPLKTMPGVVRALERVARFIGHPVAETLERLHRFQTETISKNQRAVLERLVPQYPAGTRFVILPMDMAHAGHGPVRIDLPAQHDELAALARDPRFGPSVVPFATVHPERPGAAEEVRRCLDKLGFRGLKLYPRLGFDPAHPVLMKSIYPMLAERGLPVISHCSRGGVSAKGLDTATADRFSSPEAFVPVMRAFPALRVCLAHFGGQQDWSAYVADGIDPHDPAAPMRNWQVAIRRMISGGEFPGLWSDISYTLFHFEDFAPFLKLFLEDEAVAARTLFGSDYYMTRNEALSERAVCFRLRVVLGEALFRRIAETNPRVWLGEEAEPPRPVVA
jgi:predicted TIM-barrel fold metal-dependent hydrolase